MNKTLWITLSLIGAGMLAGWGHRAYGEPTGAPAPEAVSTPPAASTTVTVLQAEAVAPPTLTKAPEAVGTMPPVVVTTLSAPTEPGPAVTHAEPEVEVLSVASFPSQGQGQNLVSVALDDVPLVDVVRLFTRISDTIATSTNLQGKVTVNLQDVEWKPALGSILDMYSLMISEKIPGSGIYSVQQKLTEPLVAQALFLNYATVSNVIMIVAPMVGKDGSVTPFADANALVVRANAANLNDIRKVVQEIDVPRKQVFIEAKFLELSDDAIKDLGISWQVLEGYALGSRGMQWSVTDSRDKTLGRSDTLGLTDSRTRADTINSRYDNNGTLYEEKNTEIQTVPGTPPIINTKEVITPTRSVADSIDQSRTADRTMQDSFTKTLTDVRTAVLSAQDFQVILSALKQMSGVSIVSNPKIIVANGETATIHIGENEPNIKGTVTAGQQGQANTTTYALDGQKPYFEFGISLEVTPTINNDSNVTVRIFPTLSRFVRNKVSPDNNTFPIEATKTIKTVFSLESGKTAAIGGLTETQDREVTTKIPLLGDIPLLGKWLFSHSHTQKSQTETIIFVTVGLASPYQIQKDQGLPEESELVVKHLAAKRALKDLNEAAAAAKASGAVTNTTPAVTNSAPMTIP